MALCLHLGRTRAELLDQVDAEEWAWWQRVSRWVPLGPGGEDERLRVMCAAMNNAMGGKATPADFRFEWGPPPKRRPDGEGPEIDFASGVKALAAMFPKRGKG